MDSAANSRAIKEKTLQWHEKTCRIVKLNHRFTELFWVTALRVSGSPHRNTDPGTKKVRRGKIAAIIPHCLQDQFKHNYQLPLSKIMTDSTALLQINFQQWRSSHGTEMVRSICWLVMPIPASNMVPNAAHATNIVLHHLTVLLCISTEESLCPSIKS